MLQKHQQGDSRSRSSIFSEFVMRRRQLLGVTVMPVGLLRVTDLQPRSPRDGGCCVTGARQHYPTLQGQGTRDYGVLSLQMWQIRCDMSVRAQEHRPLSLILVYYFFCFCSFPWYTNTPTHWNRHIHPKKKEFTLSSSQKQTQKHKYTQTGKYSYSLLHEYTHTEVHTLYSPCGCHQKQPLCPTLCKSNSVLLCFSFHCLLFSWCSLLLSTAVPSSHSMSSHLSDTSPTSRKLSAFADPLR